MRFVLDVYVVVVWLYFCSLFQLNLCRSAKTGIEWPVEAEVIVAIFGIFVAFENAVLHFLYSEYSSDSLWLKDCMNGTNPISTLGRYDGKGMDLFAPT